MTDWLLNCEPREVQLEALARSHDGVATRSRLTDGDDSRSLPHRDAGPAHGWGHFLEMRLGKTPVALNEYMLLRRSHGVRRMLVFAPNKFKPTWATEAAKFGVDALTHVYESKDHKKPGYDKFLQKSRSDGILVVNYESLRFDKHRAAIAKFTEDGKFMMVLDESAMVKNPTAQMSKYALKFAERASYKRALSGMPAPYAPYDLWAQLRILGQLGQYTNFYGFKHRFTKMGGWKGKQPMGIQNEDALNEFLRDRSFRAKKIDWGLTLGVDYEQAGLEMTKEQTEAYQAMERDFVVWLDNGDHVSAENAAAKYMKLQQIASGFMYDEEGATRRLLEFGKTPKFMDLLDRLDNYVQGKVIVIAHHTATLRALYAGLKDYNPAYIVGRMSSEETEKQKARFNETEECRVMLGQAQAIKYGHTLVGTDANPCYSLCFFENSYNLDTRAQCEARPQGAHQKAEVHIWDYHSCAVEKKITAALQKRLKVSDVIMGHYRSK